MDLLIEFARIGLGIGCVIKEFVKEDSKKLAELGARLFRFKKAYESIDSKQNALKKKIEAIRYEI